MSKRIVSRPFQPSSASFGMSQWSLMRRTISSAYAPQSYQLVSKERGPESTNPPSALGKPAPPSPRAAARRVASCLMTCSRFGRREAPVEAAPPDPAAAPDGLSKASGGVREVADFSAGAPLAPARSCAPRAPAGGADAARGADPAESPSLPGRTGAKGVSDLLFDRSPPPARRFLSEKSEGFRFSRSGPDRKS